MSIITIPKPLREKLGDDGTGLDNRITEEVAGLRVEIFNTEKRLDNRITGVEARLDNRITEGVAGLRVEI